MTILIEAFFLSFTICYLAMPSIIRIATDRGILDIPDERKAHLRLTPSLGGIGIFLAFGLTLLLMAPMSQLHELRFFLIALVIIVIIGARDDLAPLSPWIKLLGQLLSAGILMVFADVRIQDLGGLFGIYAITTFWSYVLSGIALIFLINSFNLIDGIDGLCSSVSLLILSV
ncbi:MAG: MraY family glycosyltransferase, partial [Bacteroidota bacterium]